MTSVAPSQQRIFRAVFGAVKNTADGHPDWPLDKTIALSIAKRATGTLTALYGSDVLAASLPSDQCGSLRRSRPSPRWSSGTARRTKGAPLPKPVKVGGRRSQLKLLHNAVGFMAGEAKRAGNGARAEALIDVLRLIAKQRKAA